MIGAIRRLLSFWQEPPQDERARQKALTRILDDLLFSYNSLPDYVFDERDLPEPPDRSGRVDLAMLAKNFPDLGHYHFVRPENVDLPSDPTVGDALDDLGDVLADLSEVEWRWQNISEADAIWHLKLLFENHWGRHALNLRSYLHARLFEAS